MMVSELSRPDLEMTTAADWLTVLDAHLSWQVIADFNTVVGFDFVAGLVAAFLPEPFEFPRERAARSHETVSRLTVFKCA